MKKQYVPLKLPEQWLPMIDQLARDAGHNKSSYLRWVIEKHLRKVWRFWK